MGWLKRLLEASKTLGKQQANDAVSDLSNDRLDISEREHLIQHTKLGRSLEANLEVIEKMVGPSQDVAIRRLRIGNQKVPVAVISIKEFSGSQPVEDLIEVLTINLVEGPLGDAPAHKLPEVIEDRLLQSRRVRLADTLDALWRLLINGFTAILMEGHDEAIGCSTEGVAYRAIEEPPTEPAIRGPRDGFVESLEVNVSLVRRRLRTPNLWIESFTVGSLTRTRVGIAYIKGLAHEELVDEVRQRVSRIDIDGMIASGQLEEYVEDHPLSPFPVVYRTERPDRVTAMLLEGRVAILIDGSPFVLCAPVQFSMLLRAPDDYYEKTAASAFLGTLRYFSFWASMLIPGMYVSALTFHHELIPTELLFKIVASREGVPFPIVVEVMVMELVFEILREAGLRLPRAIGSAVTIVGALVLGDAAINAGLVSPSVVIVVALTAIASFTTPNFSFSLAARLIRFAFIVLGGVFGLFGIQFGFLLTVLLLTSMRSFGYPYFAPMGPLILSEFRDVFARVWWWQMTRRPWAVGSREPVRQRPGQMPKPALEPEEVEKGRSGKWGR